MVWGCMSSHGVGRLHIVSRTVKAMDYIEILQNKLLPTAIDLLGNHSWIFQDDNAPCHRAKVVQKRTNTNHAKAMLSATIAVFFTVAPTGRNPYMGRARFELRTGVTINEETTPENNKQAKIVGISVKFSNIIKPVYTKQIDKQLL
ncbi:hypothetical protein TNCV_4424841 [Trichonephila clavipes]|nr:hypothetical protein TNCV_4424841 [Trichonephila clavipes]